MKFRISRNIGSIVFLCCMVFGTIYAVGQQILRQSANDPQIQVAEDISRLLDATNKPADFASNSRVDIANSLAPFLVIADASGKTVATTGQLNNTDPIVPVGVYTSAKKSGENRITWQPQKGVRVALIVVPYKDGFVAVGRSLREVEKRENEMLKIVGAAWGVVVILSCMGYVGMMRMRLAKQSIV
jgi:hypothetical protein